MKAFFQVAIPHRDIREGRLALDVFGADLWSVYTGRAPDEYRDPDLFFRRTYMTEGLKNLIEDARRRLIEDGGDPVIQLQTPFGGGKTHSLIALYHKAREWGAKVVVLDCEALNPNRDRLWQVLEKQLEGKVELTAGESTPGKEALIQLLERNQPVLILVDELLSYVTKASAIRVGDTNLGALTVAFMKELTEAVKNDPHALLVVTLPTSEFEKFDENAKQAYQEFTTYVQKVIGRVERVYAPVKDEEVAKVIRRRLFDEIDEREAKYIVDDFVNHLEKVGLLKRLGVEKSEYRKRFLETYPFQPEVIDTLYHKWGSYPEFQRTRGVLRILALIVNDLYHSEEGKTRAFIRLADFNLANPEIRRELLKIIGDQYDTVISADITSATAGAKKVDKAFGESLIPYRLGTKSATTIFMHSFHAGSKHHRGATLDEISLSTLDFGYSSSDVEAAVAKLEKNLFYLNKQNERYFFSPVPNLNKIIIDAMETIEESEVEELEKTRLQKAFKGLRDVEVVIWPKWSSDVRDTHNLKLIVLKGYDRELMKEIREKAGNTNREYKNVLIFLAPDESMRPEFLSTAKRYLALKKIKEKESELNLTNEQRRKISNELSEFENSRKSRLSLALRNMYRIVVVPSTRDFKEFSLGKAPSPELKFWEEIKEILFEKKQLFEKINPQVIWMKYLQGRDGGYIETKELYEHLLKTPGEPRPLNRDAVTAGIKEGVERGLFGLGKLQDGQPVCWKFRNAVTPTLEEGEVIIKPEICKQQFEERAKKKKGEESEGRGTISNIGVTITGTEDTGTGQTIIDFEGGSKGVVKAKGYTKLDLELGVPIEELYTFSKIIDYLSQKFNDITIEIHIKADEGFIGFTEYEDKILEAIMQSGIRLKKKDFEVKKE